MTTPLEDEVAIRALIGRSAYLSDFGQPEDYRQIYTEDAIWENADDRQQSADEIVSAATDRRSQGIGGPGSNSRHVVVPLVVEADTADTATATSYLTFYTHTDTQPVVALVATYRDTVRRDGDGWRISYRQITRG